MKFGKLLYRVRLGLLAALGFGSLTSCMYGPAAMYGPEPVMYGPPDMYGPPTELLPEQPQPEVVADTPELDVESQDAS